MQSMLKTISRFAKDESGATAIEYGLIAALVAVGLIAALTALGASLSKIFTHVSTTLRYRVVLTRRTTQPTEAVPSDARVHGRRRAS